MYIVIYSFIVRSWKKMYSEARTNLQESEASESACVSISLADRFLPLVLGDYYLFTLSWSGQSRFGACKSTFISAPAAIWLLWELDIL